MRLGVGCTVLARGRASGHIDGIGTYTAELLKQYAASRPSPDVLPVVFGRALQSGVGGAVSMPLPYQTAVAMSVLCGVRFPGTSSVEGRIDVFHATDHHIPKLNRVPVVATIMDVIGLRHPEWVNQRLRVFKNHAFRRATTWAQKIITISDFSADDIAQCLDVPRQDIVPIPLGVNASFFHRCSVEDMTAALNGFGLRAGYFLFVGTLQPRKNVARLIAAHASLPAAMRREHPLVIVGQAGWQNDELLPLLAGLEASGNGRWLKYVPGPQLHGILQAATALVFPSLYEGFGLPVLEAFAAGTPVVTSGTTSLPEVAGDAALLVDPLSVESIADAMRRIVEEPSATSLRAAAGLERARGFSWDKTAARTLETLRALT